MANIEELIDKVADVNPKDRAALRDQLAREVKELKSTKRFGLVYERHPEKVLLPPGVLVRPGSRVRPRKPLRCGPDGEYEVKPDERYEVRAVEGATATIAPVEPPAGGGPASLRSPSPTCSSSSASRSRSIRV